ncbi:MAG: ATP-dependent DNA ligase, partial [Mycobacteriales bacterium]
MLATLGAVPPERSGEFAFEVKWDGVRLVTYVDDKSVKAFTRNDREVSATYPEVKELATVLSGRRCVLDGEVVAFNEHGVVHFGTLQR